MAAESDVDGPAPGVSWAAFMDHGRRTLHPLEGCAVCALLDLRPPPASEVTPARPWTRDKAERVDRLVLSGRLQ